MAYGGYKPAKITATGKGENKMKKEYSFDDFKMNEYAHKPITASGYISAYSGRFDVNTSSILTRLIQEAGRFCEHFASDLFIDWKSIESFIDESAGKMESKTFLLGFREYGVDGNSFIFSRYNGGAYLCPEKEYRSIWRLDIDARGDEIKLKLGRVF